MTCGEFSYCVMNPSIKTLKHGKRPWAAELSVVSPPWIGGTDARASLPFLRILVLETPPSVDTSADLYGYLQIFVRTYIFFSQIYRCLGKFCVPGLSSPYIPKERSNKLKFCIFLYMVTGSMRV